MLAASSQDGIDAREKSSSDKCELLRSRNQGSTTCLQLFVHTDLLDLVLAQYKWADITGAQARGFLQIETDRVRGSRTREWQQLQEREGAKNPKTTKTGQKVFEQRVKL